MNSTLVSSRFFVQKKVGFSSVPASTLSAINDLLNIGSVQQVHHYLIYDVVDVLESLLPELKRTVFSEPNRDLIVDTISLGGSSYVAVEYLPGQFDQRASSALECVQLLAEDGSAINTQIFTGELFVFEGSPSEEELRKIKAYLINPVEAREKDLSIPPSAPAHPQPQPVPSFDRFIGMGEQELRAFGKRHGFAMSLADLQHIQTYFQKEEHRDPTVTEIKALDTYWSDHCRHTTFFTEITDVQFPDGLVGQHMKQVYAGYLAQRENLYKGRLSQKPVCLMDLATIAAKDLKKKGILADLEVSEEINACSVRIEVQKTDGSSEPWLLMFKNETHNHPTEIEPFGGASTCLGGCIRDPLSGRAYVYQAMRVSGAANPLERMEETLDGKLPQKKITIEAAEGFSSYGNQIGLATTQVSEIYHPGYKAKRMEVGAVIAAAPEHWVKRLSPEPGDKIVLLGGRTGRDGVGGATGSSKEHTKESLETAGAEVQKGNAPEERKIQRFFRNGEVTKLVKKCNDFGAGGISVAIGELADGLDINLDVVPTKYVGLDGTELALSESQERMAVVLAPEDVELFCALADLENLETTLVADVTSTNRLRMHWKGQTIVDISRDFLETNGASQSATVLLEEPPSLNDHELQSIASEKSTKDQLLSTLSSLNVCSQQGLAELFDSTIGASTVHMPFGGKYQLSPAEGSLQKIAVLQGETTTASAMTWGFDPELSSWSPFHGGAFAVVQSLAKIVAMGGDYQKVRFTFQEYFRKLGNDPKNWGLPFAALLGAYDMQAGFELAAIGGKDSMSGSFNDIHVPPTLISFAVTTIDTTKAISNELKQSNSHLYLLKHTALNTGVPDVAQLKTHFSWLRTQIREGTILSASALGKGGVAASLSKMAFGNKIGFEISLAPVDIFATNYGSILLESSEPLSLDNASSINLIHLGETNDSDTFGINKDLVTIEGALKSWQGTLEPIFPTEYDKPVVQPLLWRPFSGKSNLRPALKVAQPRIFIPAFPGSNCEYDSAKAFEKVGGLPTIGVFKNLTSAAIEASINEYVKQLDNSQIFMIPGGFSAGDEPDGSGKFITAVLRNERISAAIERLLERDGLILGICNGFQALVKSGLLPFGKIGTIQEEWPTLTTNKIGRHISQIVRTKITSAKSPWLATMTSGDEHLIAISHGEGRFVVSNELADKLFENGQVATQYIDLTGQPTMERPHNPNGSYFAIEGITSADGRIFGKMGHSERIGAGLYQNVPDVNTQEIYENGVGYFK